MPSESYSHEYLLAYTTAVQLKQVLSKRKQKGSKGLFRLKKKRLVNSKEYWLDIALRGCRILIEQKREFHVFVSAYWLYAASLNGIEEAKSEFDLLVKSQELFSYFKNNDLVVFGNEKHYIGGYGRRSVVSKEESKYENEYVSFEDVYAFRKALSQLYTGNNSAIPPEHDLFFNGVTLMTTYQIAYYDDDDWWTTQYNSFSDRKIDAMKCHETWCCGVPEARNRFKVLYRSKEAIDDNKSFWSEMSQNRQEGIHYDFSEITWNYIGITNAIASDEEVNNKPSYYYSKHCQNILSFVEASELYSNPITSLDVFPLLYVIFDYSATLAKKDRNSIANDIEKWIFNAKRELDSKWFNQRIDFYGSVIRGRQLIGCSLPGGIISALEQSPITRCAVAFCDCMISPDLVSDYDNSALTITSIFDLFSFYRSVIEPLAKELLDVLNSVGRKID